MSSISFDDALVKYVGQLGRGQRWIVALSSAFYIPNALAFLLLVFAAVNPISKHHWRCTDSQDATCAAVFNSPELSQVAFCSLQKEQWQFTSYDSLAAQFSLICEDAWKVQVTNSVMFTGCFVGSGVFGAASDKLGRKLPLFIATAIVAVAAFVSLAAPNYWVYAATRAATGFGAAGQAQSIFLLSAESTGPAYRGLANILSLSMFTVGEFVLVGLAYALPNWRHLTIAAGAVNVAALLLWPFISESARWLMSQGRTAEATAVLCTIAKHNGSQLPPQPLVPGHSVTPGTRDTGSLKQSPSPSIDCAVDLYANFSMGTAAELAAILVAAALVDRAGRHNCISGGLLLGGVACLAGAQSAGGGGATFALAAVGKFGCSVALAVCPTYTSELFPTCVRSTAMGIFNQASRCGSIAAPFLLMLGAQLNQHYSQPMFLPFMLFGLLSVVSGLLVLLLPETLGTALPENMQDMAGLESFFTAKPWRGGCWAAVSFLFRTRATTSTLLAPEQHLPGSPKAVPGSTYICIRASADDAGDAPAGGISCKPEANKPMQKGGLAACSYGDNPP
eukprot:gene4351-4604_t